MDTLTIQGLSVQTQIGVYAWEQKIKQQLLIDLTIPSDFSACHDELSTTLDYAVLSTRVTEFVETQAFQLIEFVANSVATLIQEEFKVKAITVSVSKPHAIKNAGMVKVTVVR